MMHNDGNNDASSTRPPKRSNSETKLFGVICLGYMVVATKFFYFVIHQFRGKKTNSLLDAYYFTVVLMTSSGYKDLTPNSNLAILLAILFANAGAIIFGALMSLGADHFLATQPKPFTIQILNSAKNHQTMQYSSVMMRKYRKFLVVSLVVHMVGGIALLVCIGNMHFFRALYCVSSTITTVLSTDECFSTEGRRIIAVFWILYGIITLSFMIYLLTEVWTERAKLLSAKKYLERNPAIANLQPSDFDDDVFIRRDAYVSYRLREIKRSCQAGMEPKIKESGRKTNGTSQNIMGYSTGGDQVTSSLRPSKPSFKDHIPKPPDPDDIWDTIIVFIAYLGSSIVIFYVTEHHIYGKKTNSFLDAVYFSFVIMTSVGYADLSPNDTLALIFASIFSLSGLLVIGKVLSTILKALDKQQEERLRKILSNKDQTVVTMKGSILKMIKKKVFILVVLMAFGTPIVVLIEDLDFIHGLYCISIRITSAGTEKCFSTEGGRVFALFWMLFGAIYKSYVFFGFTEVYIETKQRSELLKRKITPPDPKVYPPKPIDKPKPYPPPPKVALPYLPPPKPYPPPVGVPMIPDDLIEKGVSIQEDDEAAIMEEFERLDVNGTGRLTLREVMKLKQ